MPTEVKQPTPREILLAIGAKEIAAPAKLHKHHLREEASFDNQTDRALVAVLHIGDGIEQLRGICMDDVLKRVRLETCAASYFELTEAQADKLITSQWR